MRFLPGRYQVTENPQLTERRVELVAVSLALLLILWLLIGGARLLLDAGPAPVMPAEDSLKVQKLALEVPLTRDETSRILERPLFWQERRPLTPAAPVVSKPVAIAPTKLEGVTLQGVYGAGDSLGLIATVDGKLRRVGSGQSLKGWQFTSYEDGVATFTSGTRRATLALELTTPSVKLAQAVESEVQREVQDTDAESDMGGQGQPDPETMQKQSRLGGGLTFGGNGARRSKQTK